VVHHELMESPLQAPGHGRLTAVVASAAVVLALTGSAAAVAYGRPGSAVFVDTLSVGVVLAVIAVVGAVVVLAVPGNRTGWLLLAAAAVMGVGEAFTQAGIHGVRTSPGSVPAAGYLAAIGPALQAAGLLIAVVCVPIVFPDGHLPGPRWRWLPCAAAVAVACLFLGNLLSPSTNEDQLEHWHSPLGLPARYGQLADALSVIGVFLAVVAAAGAIAGLAARWRRGGPLVRQRLLLLALAVGPPALVLLAVIVIGPLPGWVFALALLPLPVAIAVAILNHGLYDLRRAAHRTLMWLTMSGAVAGIYAVVVITAAALVPDHHAWWPSAVAAALAALLLIPLRESLQRAVNRVVYGRWHEPYEVLAGLGERLEAAADVDRLLEAVLTELTTGLDLRDVGVSGPEGTVVASATAPAAPAAPEGNAGTRTAVPLHAFGVTVGYLTYRTDRRLSASGERLVRDLARQLGAVLHARLLREDLLRARERLVLAREEERRRLRRELHDGIGPALAGLTLKTETARALLPVGADRASRQLHDLGEEIRRTVLDVRRLVEGLRPPALDELGLAGACAQAADRLTAGTELTASVLAPENMPALPAAVEVAAYRIVVEAVTNTVRHARARYCQVSMSYRDDALAITVTDDGTGLRATETHGHGLAIMRERAEELGGTATITNSSPGVTVQARLPTVTTPAQASKVPVTGSVPG
jgi:signal transduction histidine kinase